MGLTSSFLQNSTSNWIYLYEFLYHYLYVFCNYGFNYCSPYYQIVYWYFPIVYYFLQKKKIEDSLIEKDFKEMDVYETTTNYIYLSTLFFLKKVLNATTIVYYINLIFKKVFFFFKITFKQTVLPLFCFFKKIAIKNHPWLVWKPIFKKTSYFGLFAYIRTKWYK